MTNIFTGQLVHEEGDRVNSELLGDFLVSNGILVPEKVGQLQEVTKYRMRNILGKNPVSDLLIMLERCGLIKLSDNPGNGFEKEKEIKILKVEQTKLVESLTKDWGASLSFEGKVKDTYFDTKEDSIREGAMNDGKKASIRIRYKVPEGAQTGYYYCTIKRKDVANSDQSKFRVCYEEEFILPNPVIFYRLLKALGLNESKVKIKDRIALSLGEIKFDFDTYKDIPPLLEIETLSESVAENYIKVLGLGNKTRLNGGSGKLFKKYKIDMEKPIIF